MKTTWDVYKSAPRHWHLSINNIDNIKPNRNLNELQHVLMFMFYFTPSLVHWANPAHLQDKRLYDRERCECGDDDDDDNAIVSIVRWVVLSKGDDCWMEVFSFIPRHLKRFSIENLWYLYIAHAARAPKRCSPRSRKRSCLELRIRPGPIAQLSIFNWITYATKGGLILECVFHRSEWKMLTYVPARLGLLEHRKRVITLPGIAPKKGTVVLKAN